MEIVLDKDVTHILDILNKNGEGYVVGGYIRDILLGIPHKDCDFCTNMEYEKIKDIFKEYHPKEIGKAFGIIQIKYDGNEYEIAKYRKDLEFTEKRNVGEVIFVDSIKEDIYRRDFTVNAIAYNGKELVYPKYALEDIKNRVIRFVGESEKRIKEDPLRSMRAIRIASQKNMKILKETEDAIKKKSKEIKRVSIERIQDELFKILEGENVDYGVEKLFELNLFQNIFNIDVSIEKRKEINKLKKKSLKGIEILTIIFQKLRIDGVNLLKLDKKREKIIRGSIKKYLDFKNLNTGYSIKKFINKNGEDIFKNLLNIYNFFGESYDVRKKYIEILEKKEPIYLKDMKVSGRDIIDLGIAQGEEIKKKLELLLDMILENPELNKKEILMEILKEGQ